MALYFRKRIKIAPGIRINLSKSGISTSIGPKGANINIGSRGTYVNTSIPGTGLYNRQKISGSTYNSPQDNTSVRKNGKLIFGVIGILGIILLCATGMFPATLSIIMIIVVALIGLVFLLLPSSNKTEGIQPQVIQTEVEEESSVLDETPIFPTENLPIHCDPLFIDAACLTIKNQLGSVSILQSELGISSNRAERILEQMTTVGIVTPPNENQVRETIIKSESELKALLNNPPVVNPIPTTPNTNVT